MKAFVTISLLFFFTTSSCGKILVKNLILEKQEIIYTFKHYENNCYYLDSRKLLHKDDSITFVSNRSFIGSLLRKYVYLQKKMGDPEKFQELDIETRVSNYGFENWELNLFTYLSDRKFTSSNLFYLGQDSISNIFLRVYFSGEVFLVKNLHGELDDSASGYENSTSIKSAFVFNSLSTIEPAKLCSDCVPFVDTVRYFRHD